MPANGADPPGRRSRSSSSCRTSPTLKRRSNRSTRCIGSRHRGHPPGHLHILDRQHEALRPVACFGSRPCLFRHPRMACRHPGSSGQHRGRRRRRGRRRTHGQGRLPWTGLAPAGRRELLARVTSWLLPCMHGAPSCWTHATFVGSQRLLGALPSTLQVPAVLLRVLHPSAIQAPNPLRVVAFEGGVGFRTTELFNIGRESLIGAIVR